MSDLISRAELMNILQLMLSMEDLSYGKKVYGKVIQQVKSLPTIEAEPKHGRWIKSKKSDYNWECSNCGYGLSDYRTTYCYDCGARMDEVENERF